MSELSLQFLACFVRKQCQYRLLQRTVGALKPIGAVEFDAGMAVFHIVHP